MSANDLKAILHESIENVDDMAVLEAISDVLRVRYSPHDIEALTPEQTAKVNLAVHQIENGELFSNEQANALVREWLNR